MGLQRSNITGVNQMLKRGEDVVLGILALVIFAGPMLIIAVLIRMTSAGPVLFLQKRVGLHGRRFAMAKFRTMAHRSPVKAHRDFMARYVTAGEGPDRLGLVSVDEQGAVYKLTNDPRITPFGRFLRKFSLDELPQIFNVIRGDMSFVGPRPELPYAVAKYHAWQTRRLDAKPGMTGLWQVSGRNALTYEQMVQLDIEYIASWSLLLDLQILLKSVGVVLAGGGR